MKKILVRYKVKPRSGRGERRTCAGSLRRATPGGAHPVRHATFRLDDGPDVRAHRSRGVGERCARYHGRIHARGGRTNGVALDSAAEAEVIRATERDRLRAFVAKDMELANKLHANDFQLINPLGMVSSKEQYLGDVASGDVVYRVWEPETPMR